MLWNSRTVQQQIVMLHFTNTYIAQLETHSVDGSGKVHNLLAYVCRGEADGG